MEDRTLLDYVNSTQCRIVMLNYEQHKDGLPYDLFQIPNKKWISPLVIKCHGYTDIYRYVRWGYKVQWGYEIEGSESDWTEGKKIMPRWWSSPWIIGSTELFTCQLSPSPLLIVSLPSLLSHQWLTQVPTLWVRRWLNLCFPRHRSWDKDSNESSLLMLRSQQHSRGVYSNI